MSANFSFKAKLILLAFFIILTTYVLYWQSLNYFFLQDDWFHLNISKASNIHEFLNFFTIRTDIIAWRPVSKQLFFFLSQMLFGLNPFWPHIIIFILYLSNIFLIYRLIHQLLNSHRIAIITGFLYGTSSIHFTPLSWLSAGEYVIGTLFWLLCVSSYLFFKKERRVSTYLLFVIYFIFCLASTEFALTIPLVVLGYELLTKNYKFNNRRLYANFINAIKFLVPIIFLILVYIVLRTIVYPIPIKDDYGLSINFHAVNTYIWYGLWSLNVPEVFKSQIILSKLTLTQNLVEALKIYTLPLSISFTIFALTIIYTFLKNLNYKTMSLFFLSLFFLFVCISPVLFLPNHTFAHYLSIPSIGIYAFIGYLLSKLSVKGKIHSVLIIVSLTSWFLLSLTSLFVTRKTHWIPGESSISKQVYEASKANLPKVQSSSTVIVYPSTEQVTQALMNQHALKVIYNDNTVKTIFDNSNITPTNAEGATYLLKLN